MELSILPNHTLNYILNHIPIPPICKMVGEYYHHPRPYLRELEYKVRNILSAYDMVDFGYTNSVIYTDSNKEFYLGMGRTNEKGVKITALYCRENNRRIDMGLRPHSDIAWVGIHNQGWMAY